MKRAFLIDFENVKSAGLVGLEDLNETDQVIILYSVNSNTISFEMHQKIMQSPACVDYYQIKRGGKNSLDFQLSSLLGYLLGSGEYTHLYVVSNDAGFDVLRDFWTSGFVHTDCIVYRRVNLTACLAHSSFLEKETDGSELEDLMHKNESDESESNVESIEIDVLDKIGEQSNLEDSFQEVAQLQPKKTIKPKNPRQPSKKTASKVQTEFTGYKLTAEEQAETMGILAQTNGKQEFYRKLIAKYGQKKGLEIYKTLKSDYSNLKNKMVNV